MTSIQTFNSNKTHGISTALSCPRTELFHAIFSGLLNWSWSPGSSVPIPYNLQGGPICYGIELSPENRLNSVSVPASMQPKPTLTSPFDTHLLHLGTLLAHCESIALYGVLFVLPPPPPPQPLSVHTIYYSTWPRVGEEGRRSNATYTAETTRQSL